LPGVGFTGDALLTDDAMWIRQKEAFLYGVDLETLDVIEQISPEEPLAGGSVIIAFDSIWVTANDDNLVARLSLAP